MEVIEQQKSQEDQSVDSPAAEREGTSRLWVTDVTTNFFFHTLSVFGFPSGDVAY